MSLNAKERAHWAAWKAFCDQHEGCGGRGYEDYPGAAVHFRIKQDIDAAERMNKLENEITGLKQALSDLDRHWQEKLKQPTNCCGAKHENKPE